MARRRRAVPESTDTRFAGECTFGYSNEHHSCHSEHKRALLFRMDGRRFNGPAARALRRATGVKMREFAVAIQTSYGHLRMAETAGRDVSDEVAHRYLRELSARLGRQVDMSEISLPDDSSGNRADTHGAAV